MTESAESKPDDNGQIMVNLGHNLENLTNQP
jgi:hypothetical protein